MVNGVIAPSLHLYWVKVIGLKKYDVRVTFIARLTIRSNPFSAQGVILVS